MKLLLTSQGLHNQSIVKALQGLLGKPLTDISICIISTASLYSDTDKRWFIEVLQGVVDVKPKHVDIVDISAVSKDNWLPRLKASDVMFFTGGNTIHLMRILAESGLEEELPSLLETRVYMGNSAGSIVATPDVSSAGKERTQNYMKTTGYTDMRALGYVDFYIRPHLNDPSDEYRLEPAIREFASTTDRVVYALDDDSAVKVVDGNIEIVSEGEYLVLNNES